MDLRYCGQCGEAYLLSKGSCIRCAHAKPSKHNTGVKTALLLGIISIGAPGQGYAEPPKNPAETHSTDAHSASHFTIRFAENEAPSTETAQEIKAVIQRHLSTIEDRHKQYKSKIGASTLSLQVHLRNGSVTKVEVIGETGSVLRHDDSDSFVQAVVQDSTKWVFPKELTQKFSIYFSIISNESEDKTSKPTVILGGLDSIPHASVAPKYGVPSWERIIPQNRVQLNIVKIDVSNDNEKAKQSRNAMNQRLRKSILMVKRCYRLEMRYAGDIRGDMHLTFVIHEGKVNGVKVKSNRTGSERLATCIQRKIKQFQLPHFCSGSLEVKYVFKTENHK